MTKSERKPVHTFEDAQALVSKYRLPTKRRNLEIEQPVVAAQGVPAWPHSATHDDTTERLPEPIDAPKIEGTADTDKCHTRRARITWACEIEPEPVVWAWEPECGQGRIPAGTLSIVAGREGSGKSSFAIWLAAQITRGQLPGSFFGTPRTVFFVAVEDSWKQTLVPRLLAAGACLERVARFDVVIGADAEVTLSLPLDNELLEQEMTKHGAALVVIDPLMSVIGERIDTHREREVRSALDPLAKMADRTGAVLLGIAHFNKAAGADVASLITGSGAFKNVPRSVFGFARDHSDDSGGRVMTQAKNSLGRDDLPSLSYRMESVEIATRRGPAITARFEFTGISDKTVSDLLREQHCPAPRQDGLTPPQRFLLRYITENADANGEVESAAAIKAGEEAGYTEDDMKNARKRCKVPRIGTRKLGLNRGWVWWIETEGVKGVAPID